MSRLRRVSLRWLVPAISGAILTVVVALFGTITYRSVRTSTLDAAAERLMTVAQVLAQPPQTPAVWIRDAHAAAASPEVIEIVRSGGQRVSDAARARVARLTPDTGLTLASDVRAANGTVLFSITSAVAESLSKGRAPAAPARDSTETSSRLANPARLRRLYPDSATQSELYTDSTHVLYERAVPIRANGRTVGHVVQVRKMAAAATTLRQLSSLIGREAALVVGNRDGSLWTDMIKPIPHPGASPAAQYYVRDGRRWISATSPVSMGPWVIGTEFPEDIVLAPVHALRSRLILMGAGIILVAILLTERLSRRLTGPLLRLTTAAEEIAAGRRMTPVHALDRSDEIGRLSRAFAAMAQSIRTSHDTLEFQIGERTVEVQSVLSRLQNAQEELVRQERLATLGHVSGSIAHELRNPLGVMTNALFYLETVLGEAPQKVREHLAKLRTQVRLSESIITGLLSFTRTGTPQVRTISVAQLVDEQLARISVPPVIEVRRDIASRLPDLLVDPVHVAQILMNLFTNAIQAMGETGGMLTVRAREAGDRVRIEIADTGPGVPPEDRERIFEPLFTTKARGIGLGLSVSQSLARANNGELTLVPQFDHGAILAVELPAAPPAHVERDPYAHEVPQGR